jgi:hypothetical protein
VSMRILKSSELSLISSQTMSRIGQHSIGFVRLIGEEDDAVIAGSGTLIAAGGRHAILTADHVLEKVPSSGSLWLVICREVPTTPNRLHIDASATQKITIGKASHDHHGPDIGILLLSRTDAERLQTWLTFYNIDKRREQVLNAGPLTEDGWLMFGMLDELTKESGPEGRFTKVKAFNGSVLFGAKPIERQDAEFDYLDSVALYDEGYTGPESYRGASGGGLWQVSYREREGDIDVADAILSGVVYYESPRPANERVIYCHGRRSVYERVYAEMAK